MALVLKVPNLGGSDCVKTITEAITTIEPDAQVQVDVDAKTVSVESGASEETIKQAVTSAGYTIEGY